MGYKVANASEFLVITGAGIEDIKLEKKAFIWPGQECSILDLTPVNYTLHVNAMSAEKLPFLLPAVFTIGPRAEDREKLIRYAKLLSSHQNNSTEDRDLVEGIIEGETRVIAASMTMEEIFKGNKEFKQRVFENVQLELDKFGLLIYNANIKQLVDCDGHEYFSFLGKKIQMEAANRAKIDVAEANMKGEIGSKERTGLTIQSAAKIDAETKIIATKRKGEGKKEEIKVKTEVKIFENERDAEVAEANAKLTTDKASWAQQAQMAQVEAQKAVAIREAELQQEVERKNALTQTEKLKADFLSKATVEYDIKVLESNSELYQKQKASEAVLYRGIKGSEAERQASEAQLYAIQKAADAELYRKKREAEGMMVLAAAQGTYIKTLLKAVGGNYGALRDYLMIKNGLFKDIAQMNAEAVTGLNPKISVWKTGDGGDGGAEGGAMKEVASVYKALPPLFETVQNQTAMLPSL
jgi:flotillin